MSGMRSLQKGHANRLSHPYVVALTPDARQPACRTYDCCSNWSRDLSVKRGSIFSYDPFINPREPDGFPEQP